MRNSSPIPLPEPWKPAWIEPSGEPRVSFGFSFYRVYTDEGIVGVGPFMGDQEVSKEISKLIGFNPFHVEEFWHTHMSGKGSTATIEPAAGIEIALWDIIGKAADKPVYSILGAYRDRIPVYAATSRLLEKERHVRQVQEIMDAGFKAVKLRLHRPDPRDDLAVVEAVRRAVGDDMVIMVDANQNNKSEGYNYWSRGTALKMAEELQKLKVYFLEEPLPRPDVEGLAAMTASLDMPIAGGEHSQTIYEFREHLLRDAYDILQPDVVLMGNFGITGLRKTAFTADYFGKSVIPHVCSDGNFSLGLAATLQAMATVENCPMVEYPYDPPILTAETMQTVATEPIRIEGNGCVAVPDKPGIGVELDEDRLSGNMIINTFS